MRQFFLSSQDGKLQVFILRFLQTQIHAEITEHNSVHADKSKTDTLNSLVERLQNRYTAL